MTVKREPIAQILNAELGDVAFLKGLDDALSNIITAAKNTGTEIEWRTLRIEPEGDIEVHNGYGDIQVLSRGLHLSVDTIWIEDDE